jgi:acetolactate synthase-1/2/3 large subunit
VHLSAAHQALADLQDAAALPVATSIMGKGAVDERHPLSIGVAGHTMGVRGMARHLRPLFDDADVVLLVGTRTDQNTTDDWTLLPPTATLIHLDLDGGEIGRNYEAVRLAGDAGVTLEALRAALEARDLGKRQAARAGLEGRIAAAREAHVEEARPMTESNARPIRPERIMAEAARQLTEDSVVVSDASFSHVWTANYLPALRPGMRMLQPRGLAGLGWGLPMAIGAKLAAPDSPVLVFAGDGGFGHVWSELETSRRMDVPVVMTVFNNQVLGFQALAETMRFGRHTDACDFAPVDHAAIARACGCHGLRVEDPNDYADALRAALANDRTTLIDVITDPAAFPPITLFDDHVDGG